MNFRELELWSGGVNVAVAGKASWAPGILGGYWTTPASRGNDGSITSGLAHSRCGAGEWWEVKLAKPAVVDSVVVYNREGYNGRRMKNSTITGRDAGGSIIWAISIGNTQKDEYNLTP